jgi:hypothetical protein
MSFSNNTNGEADQSKGIRTKPLLIRGWAWALRAPFAMSIIIPQVNKAIREAGIRAIMAPLKLGCVEQVDIVPRKTPRRGEHSRVHVHYSSWNVSDDPTTSSQVIELIETAMTPLGMSKTVNDFTHMVATTPVAPVPNRTPSASADSDCSKYHDPDDIDIVCDQCRPVYCTCWEWPEGEYCMSCELSQPYKSRWGE